MSGLHYYMRHWLIYNEANTRHSKEKYKNEINPATCLRSDIYKVDTCKTWGTIIYNTIATK